VLHIDSVRTPRRLDHGEIVAHFSRLRTAASFRVCISVPPNSCARCGTEQRGHDTGHAYTAPDDALRLARMKERRRVRHNPPTAAPLPEVLATFTADTTRFTQAMQRLGEAVARSIEPFHAQLRSMALTLSSAAGEAHWPADAKATTCAHVCGGSPDHVCDARATTTIRHPLPSGGTRVLPLCVPCAQAEESAATAVRPAAAAEPPTPRTPPRTAPPAAR